jgi:hypothetical protein
MLSAIKFQWRIRNLNRQRDRVQRIYQAKRRALKNSGQPVPSFSSEEWNDQNAINAEIYKLETAYLSALAMERQRRSDGANENGPPAAFRRH